MSSVHVYARNGNIKGIQDEINRDPNVVNGKDLVRNSIYHFIYYHNIILIS